MKYCLIFYSRYKLHSHLNKIQQYLFYHFEINYLSNNPNDTSDFINEINEKIAYKIEAVILNKRAKDKSDKEWKDLFVEFISLNGIENLNHSTKYKKLGNRLSVIKTKYNKAKSNEQKI